MGQKVNPHGFRVGVIEGWESNWYADKDYQKFLLEDIKIREFIKDKLFLSGISKVDIERASNKARITIYTAKPGMVINNTNNAETITQAVSPALISDIGRIQSAVSEANTALGKNAASNPPHVKVNCLFIFSPIFVPSLKLKRN